jgi:hypothetical protein
LAALAAATGGRAAEGVGKTRALSRVVDLSAPAKGDFERG